MRGYVDAASSILGIVACTFLTACAHDANRSGTAIVKDSSGTRVVENVEPVWITGYEWKIAPRSAIEVGGKRDNGSWPMLRYVVGGSRLRDGRFVLGNAGTQELLFYDRQGQFVERSGPSRTQNDAFRDLRWIQAVGDSIFAYDHPHIDVFDNRGSYARSITVESLDPSVWPAVVGVFRDGSALVQLVESDDAPGGLHWPVHECVRYFGADAQPWALGPCRGRELFVQMTGRTASYPRLPFARSTWVVPEGEHYTVATNDGYEFRRYSWDGILELTVRKKHNPLKVESRDLDVFAEQLFNRGPNSARAPQYRQRFADVVMSRIMPAYGWVYSPRTVPLLVDDGGNTWVLDYARPWEEQRRWSVFDSVGVWLGTVEALQVIEPLHIGTDFLLGLWRDSLDVERVHLFDLIKPGQ
jgi:hypothetical protein